MAGLLRVPQLISEDQDNNVLLENTRDLFCSLGNRIHAPLYVMLQTLRHEGEVSYGAQNSENGKNGAEYQEGT